MHLAALWQFVYRRERQEMMMMLLAVALTLSANFPNRFDRELNFFTVFLVRTVLMLYLPCNSFSSSNFHHASLNGTSDP